MAKVDKATGEIVSLDQATPVMVRELRHAFSNFDDRSHAADLLCLDESRASQSDKDECDINILVRRFGVGQVPVRDLRAPSYGDFTDLRTPHEMAQALVEAQGAFMKLPAQVRAEFDNDPHRFVDFCSQDENYDRICDLGLLAPEPMQKRQEARRAAEAAAMQEKVDQAVQERLKAAKPAEHS